MATDIGLLVQLQISYVISRATAPDGPRLKDVQPTGGDYGVPMPRAYGEKVRAPGIFIAQDDLDEDKHKAKGLPPITGFLAIGKALSPSYYTYSVPALAVLLADRVNDDPIEGIEKVMANGKLIFKQSTADLVSETFGTDGKLFRRKYGKNKFFKSLTIYTGHTEQTVDPVLAGELNETGAFPFTAYMVIEDLQLTEAFGNAVPSIEAIIQVKTGQSLAETAESICAAAGIDTLRDISTTALADSTPRGYLINEESTCWDALKPLMPVFGVDCAEVAGQLRFYRRSQSMRATLTTDDMGAHVQGDNPPEKYLFKRNPDLSLPQATTLNFLDVGRDYQPNSATSSRTEGDARSNISVTLPLSLTADEAASAAALMHWDAWLGRTAINFTLTDSWVSMATGLAYGIPAGGTVVPYRITRKLRGANGIIEVEALSDESVTYTAEESGTSGTMPPEDSTDFPDTRLVLMDMSILSDDDDDYGFYVVVGDAAPGWTRGRVQASEDGVIFHDLSDEPESAPTGDVIGTLAAGSTTGLDDTLDTTSVLTVLLEHDVLELESATDAELDDNKNLSFVGKDGLGEYIQFKTATKVDVATWELTNLRRGRRGTDHAIATHTSGEEFALVDGPGVFRVTQPLTDWGDLLYFRGVTLHQEPDEADEQTFTNTGEGKRPFSPVNVEGTWAGDDLTITADLRSRLFAGGLGIDDNDETDWEFFGGTGHSETVAGSTVTFTAAEQTAAGLTPGETVTGRVRQTSDVNDGRWRNFTIIGSNNFLALEDDSTPLELEDGSTDFELG
jgi:hypothetical protein